MPEAGRLGDNARVPSDSHGSVCCAHDCVGPATKGSEDVLINGRPALRIQDVGVHSSCCGANQWQAVAGAPAVLINDRKAHRLGDATQHCGGGGKLIEGSGDVIIGDSGGSSSPADMAKTWIAFRVKSIFGDTIEGVEVEATGKRTGKKLTKAVGSEEATRFSEIDSDAFEVVLVKGKTRTSVKER